MTDLRSAPVPGPRPEDHVRGPQGAPLVVVYADFSCPRCAVAWTRLAEHDLRVVFRHFALKAKHPRAVPLALASEAAARQGAFWELHDRLYADQGRQDDPHLWGHVKDLGLDSLGVVEMLFEVEDLYGFQVHDPARYSSMSFNDRVADIEATIRAAHNGQLPEPASLQGKAA